MEPELSQELHDTVVGMRNAGAERAAVVQRLQDEGFDFDTAGAVVDRIDTQIAQRHGARPADMRADIADRAEAARQANLASTGLAPESVEQRARAQVHGAAAPAARLTAEQLVAAAREKLASDGRVLLQAGMTEQALTQQWKAAGIDEGNAQDLLQDTHDLAQKDKERQASSKKRMNLAAMIVMAIMGALGIFGIIMMLQGPTSSERATRIAASACGADEARLIDVDGQVLLLGGEAMNVKNSIGVENSEFDELYQSGTNGQPDHVLCSVVSLLPIEYCDGYVDVTTGGYSGMFRDDDEPQRELTVQIQGSALIVKKLTMENYQEQDSVRIETNPHCPAVFRGTFGSSLHEVHRPNPQQGLEAIRDLVSA